MNAWLLLAGAIVTEIIATTNLKLAEGFTKPIPSAIVIVGYVVSFWCASLAMKTLPLSITYAIWSGAGTLAITLIAVFFMHEPMTLIKAGAILMIVIGAVLLNLGTANRMG
jgi:multidrug transporter EmrE-like cation transporter